MKFLHVLALALVVQTSTLAQVTLVKDIGTLPASMVKFSEELVNSGNLTYFKVDGFSGPELWRTDGTSNGTFKIVGPASTSSTGITSYVDFNGQVLYIMDNNLYKTDGTVGGSQLIKDITTSIGQNPDNFVFLGSLNGKMYYVTMKSVYTPYVADLWSTDGTNAGTQKVTTFGNTDRVNIFKGPSTTSFLFFTKEIFTGGSSTGTKEFWRTDGTEGGTTLIKQIGYLTEFHTALFDGNIYFTSNNSTGDKVELWKTDGTPVNTNLVKTINSFNIEFVTGDNKMFLINRDGATESAGIYVSDGTDVGTVRLQDTYYYVVEGGVLNGNFYAIIQYPGNATTIFDSDGTPGGTHVNPLPGWSQLYTSYPGPAKVFKNKLVFTINDVAGGQEAVLSDGTVGGTILLKDINPGSGNSLPYGFTITPDGNHMLFIADDGEHGTELWITDGTENNTQLLKDTRPGTLSSHVKDLATDFVQMGEYLYFTAIDANQQTEGTRALWRTEGTEGGTVQNYTFSNYAFLAGVAKNKMLFSDYDGGYVIWGLDGQTNPDPLYASNVDAAAQHRYNTINGITIFPAQSSMGTELWVSDGTPPGTKLLKDIKPGSSSSVDSHLPAAILGTSKLIFSADDGTGNDIWSTDGTSQNTVKVKDINTSPGSGSIVSITSTGNVAYFATVISSNILWKTDGTSDGTVQVKDFGANNIYSIWSLTNTVVFLVYNVNHSELWKTDGTQGGTVKVKEIMVSNGLTITTVGDKLYFTGKDVGDTGPDKLVVTDGTVEGTHYINYEDPDLIFPTPVFMAAVGGFLYFTADQQLWRTAGTSGSTEKIGKYAPNAMIYYNNYVYFQGDSEDYGVELFKVPYTEIEQVLTFGEIPTKTMGEPDFTVSAQSTSDAIVQFNGNNKISITGNSVKLVKPGLATVTAYVGGAYTNAAVSRFFCINPAQPTITATNDHSVNMVLTSSAADGNQWFLDGLPLEGRTSKTLPVDKEGNYTVKSTVDGCVGELSTGFTAVILGLEKMNAQLGVFPNPTSKELMIEWQGNEQVHLEILNIHGQSVYKAEFHNSHNVDVSRWSNDLYIAKIKVNDVVLWRKVMKQ